MTTTTSTMTTRLTEALRRREIQRVVYFHCDHWEPWKTIEGKTRAASLPFCAERIRQFTDTMQRLDYGRALTLFYKPGVYSALDTGTLAGKGVRVHADDKIVFLFRSASADTIGREALRYVVEAARHGIEVHVHHEDFTHSTASLDKPNGAYLATPAARAHEETRFDLAVRLILDAIRQETGNPLERWFFVHGLWALQASDPTVCHLVREVEILAANGCRGDFTFPAGRQSVNPRLEVPYFVSPIPVARGYDLAEGQPEIAYGNAAAAREKFFVWSSPIKHRGCSLDYYAPWVRTRLDDPEAVAHDLIAGSYAVDGTLFVKTHAHSMHPTYFEAGKPPAFPLAEPAVQAMLGALFEAAAAAGAPVDFLTAAEVYDRFIGAVKQPAEGFALSVPGAPVLVPGIVPPPASFDPTARRDGDPWRS